MDDIQQLADTLKHKRGKYDTAGVPLVVAANCVSSFMNHEDVASALLGATAWQFPLRGNADEGRWVRQPNGAWMGERGPRGKRLSAVLAAKQLHPATFVTSQLTLWTNPWADAPLNVEWPFSCFSATDTGQLTHNDKTADMASLLGLPGEWPGPDPPFAATHR